MFRSRLPVGWGRGARLLLAGFVLFALGCEDGLVDDPEDFSRPEGGTDAPSFASTEAARVAAAGLGGNPKVPGIASPSAELDALLADVLRDQGPLYRPRTHHLHDDGSPLFTNRLILETSPYLHQHAHNPVNWFPWSDEAFSRAREEGKPILLSVGYSTCHWCHVMERESFEDLEIARFLNEHFIAIKVDREERPDVDSIYMKAVRILTGRGGWPMTVALTPDRQPFFGGTYFPARDGDRGSRKGFLTILGELSERYQTDAFAVVEEAAKLSQRLQAQSRRARPAALPGPDAIARAARRLASSFDTTWGGFGKGKKFPRPANLELLLRYHRRTGDPQALQIVTHTLDKMADGGIHDHVGGGFHRYSVDRRWGVPHFEKMLYDNAQLVVVYLEAWQVTGNERYRAVAARTLDYVAREMTHEQGGFFSATDADSPVPGKDHDEEGWYFSWTPQELRAVLGPELSRLVEARYGVRPRGNFEGRNILRTDRKAKDVAQRLGIDEDALLAAADQARPLLLAARSKRAPPGLDDKVLTAWNGLMISAFARGALALGEERYADCARKAATFVLDSMRVDGRLRRSWRNGELRYSAYLEDHAFLIEGLLDLFEATSELRWLDEALALQALLDRDYGDSQAGGYFRTPRGHEALLTREKPSSDGAQPSGNSVAAPNLLRLAEFTGDEAHRRRAERLLQAFGASLRSGNTGLARMLCALDYLLEGAVEVVVVRTPGDANLAPLLAPLRQRFLPNRAIVMVDDGKSLDRAALVVPLLQSRLAQKGRTTAYVCKAGYCKLPTSDPAVFAAQLGEVEPLLPQAPPALELGVAEKTPAAWHYDEQTQRHWHPGHDHWHKGPPPKGAR